VKIRDLIFDKDKEEVKKICFSCGSKSIENTYNYFRTACFYSGNNVLAEIIDGIGLYFALRCKHHVRLIALAVSSQYQWKGYGKLLHERLKGRVNAYGLRKITIRTEPEGSQMMFLTAQGYKEQRKKGHDIEMELNT
jgi:GNAT superfamily N-acetyltransferase